LIIGTNLASIKSSSLAIIKNAVSSPFLTPSFPYLTSQGIISINQDSLGKAATYFTPSGQAGPTSGQLYPYWAGPLSDGVVVGIVAANGALNYNVALSSVPGLGSGTWSWTEFYSGKTGSGTSISGSLASHDMAVYKITKTSGSGTTTSVVKPTSTSTAPTTTSSSGGGTVTQWGQCGGSGWTGGTVCVSPYTCTYSNSYYSQCL
jgi:hypothetical protein